jgi:hypothetical protein
MNENTTMVTTPRTSTAMELSIDEEERELERSSTSLGYLLTEESVGELEKQVALIKRQRVALIKLTEPEHWQDFSGTPYLKDGGIQTVASILGIQFSEPKATFEETDDEQGKAVICRCEMTASFRGRSQSDVGSATSRDAIYKGKSPALLRNEIEKKAITNSQHRALAKLTGLGGVTWGMLESLGYRRGGGGAVRFKGTEQKQATGAGAWTPAKEKLWSYLLELTGGEEAAQDSLQQHTAIPKSGYAGTRDVVQLSEKQIAWLLPRVEREWKKLFSSQPEPQVPPASGGAAPRASDTPWTADQLRQQELEGEAQSEPGERG